MQKNTVNIALGIIRRNNEVLLVERRNKEEGLNNESLKWVFPGGKIEASETPLPAAEREVYEETGLYVKAIKILDKRKHPSFPANIHYVACVLSERNADKVNDFNTIQAKWVSITELNSYITSSLNKEVRGYLFN